MRVAPGAVPAAGVAVRDSTRVIVFDPEERVLLLNTSDLCTEPLEWWELPGGGIDPGETVEEAARRELREETGIVVQDVGPCLGRVREEGWFADRLHRQDEWVFAVRLDAVPAIEPALVGDVERAAHLGHAWWRLDDAIAAGLRLYPRELPGLAARAAHTYNGG